MIRDYIPEVNNIGRWLYFKSSTKLCLQLGKLEYSHWLISKYRNWILTYYISIHKFLVYN